VEAELKPSDRHPEFDPELIPALKKAQEECGGSSWSQAWMIELRERLKHKTPTLDTLRRGGRIVVDECMAEGPAGAPDVPLLRMRQAGQLGPAPLLYHIHGGGMVMGCNRDDTEQLADWVESFGCVVIAPEYRLAPENPHPAPLDDCYAGLVWSHRNADTLGVDRDRIVVAGASAGGGIAAGLALMARDGRAVQLLGQLLMCPMLDDRNETPSSYELEGDGIWDRVSNIAGWEALLGGERGTAEVSSHAAPARAGDLSGLPPAFLDVGSVDVLRDEVIDYASRILRAGGSAELHVWPGGFHGFDLFAPNAKLSLAASAARVDWLARLFELPK
jgi:acetyl esterase/lipase